MYIEVTEKMNEWWKLCQYYPSFIRSELQTLKIHLYLLRSALCSVKKKTRRVRRQENTLTTAWPGTRHLQVFRNPKGQVEITYARLAYISIGYNQMYHYFLYALPVCLSADVWIHTWGYMLQRPYRVYIKVPRGNLWSLTVTRRNHEINHRMYVWRVDSIGWIR